MGKSTSTSGRTRHVKQSRSAHQEIETKKTRVSSRHSSSVVESYSPASCPDLPATLARKNELILALDFGTTFSGIAYVYRHHGVVSRSTDINDIHSWPGDGGSNHKAPTKIKYLPQSDSNLKWGYEVNPTDDHIFGLKLLFDPDQPKSYDVTDVCTDPLDLPKPIEDVAADFMRALYKHATDMICRSIAADETELNKLYEKQYVITVPAVWSDKAKHLTFEAARKAGVYPLDLITEPEAAALYTLDWMKGKGLRENSAVVICDAGGGTVDLVTYKINQIDPLQLSQLTSATGAVAGAISLDARFHQEVQKAVGFNQFLALKSTKAYRSAMREFDVNVKQAFQGLDDEDKYVTFPTAQLPDNSAMGLESNTMAFSAKRVADMFEPTINTIIDLVRDQIKSASESDEDRDPVQFVFLVGGFGSNNYLRKKLEESIPNVKIVQPEAARKAVMMGAVLSKLSSKPVVLSTRAGKSYGTFYRGPYNETSDNGRQKYWDQWQEIYTCDKMTWSIRKGTEMDRSKRIPVTYSRSFEGHDPKKDNSTTISALYESTEPVIDYPDDHMRVNCNLVVDLHQIPDSHFTRRYRTSDRAKYSTLDYELLIENNQSGLMRFSLEIDGKEYGAVEAYY